MNCCYLVNIIEDYYAASGQAINFHKSFVFFSANTPPAVSRELKHILNMQIVFDPGTYLGVPAMWDRSKRQGLAFIKGRVLQKIQGWTQSTLSHAGNEVLIKVVA